MTASVAWPSSRIVAGWWPELASSRPQRLWISSWHLHHIEALVGSRHPCHLDPLSTALLRLLDGPSVVAVEDLPSRLRLEAAVVARLFQGLNEAGLATTEGGRWLLTAAGRQCRGSGEITARERRSFYFLDRSNLQEPPHFLALAANLATPLDTGPDWRFDPSVLADCIRADAVWKDRYRFPLDVESLLLPEAGNHGLPIDWQRVVLDRPEQLVVLVAELPPEGPSSGGPLVAYAVQPQSWALRRAPAALELGPTWGDVFPDLQQPFPIEAWMQGWRAWCQPRALPVAEVDACELTPTGCVLQVRAPRTLIDRLRGSRSEANKPEPWVLAGSGRVRALARLEIAEKS